MTKVRCGIGYDLHRLAEGRPLIIGGITVPFDKGPVGHSDGDVLAHALCDALLGAGSLGDIGTHFPDSRSQVEKRRQPEISRVHAKASRRKVHAH